MGGGTSYNMHTIKLNNCWQRESENNTQTQTVKYELFNLKIVHLCKCIHWVLHAANARWVHCDVMHICKYALFIYRLLIKLAVDCNTIDHLNSVYITHRYISLMHVRLQCFSAFWIRFLVESQNGTIANKRARTHTHKAATAAATQ